MTKETIEQDHHTQPDTINLKSIVNCCKVNKTKYKWILFDHQIGRFILDHPAGAEYVFYCPWCGKLLDTNLVDD